MDRTRTETRRWLRTHWAVIAIAAVFAVSALLLVDALRTSSAIKSENAQTDSAIRQIEADAAMLERSLP